MGDSGEAAEHRIARTASVVIKSLEELRQWEDFYAYPGPGLLNVLIERATSGDAAGTVRLARTISTAMVTHSYRHNVGEWEKEEEGLTNLADRLPVNAEQKSAHRPYFEVLFVSPARQAMWRELGQELRRLRRPQDKFVYESVFVGSFEDAVLAVILNGSLEAVVIYDDVPFASAAQQSAPAGIPDLVSQREPASRRRPCIHGLTLAQALEAHPAGTGYLPALRSGSGESGRQSGGSLRAADLLPGRGAAGDPSEHSGRHCGPVFHSVFRQSSGVRAETDRNVPCAPGGARKVDLQIELDPRHGRVLRNEPVPRRVLSHHRRIGQPAGADREHQGRAGHMLPARLGPITSSL